MHLQSGARLSLGKEHVKDSGAAVVVTGKHVLPELCFEVTLVLQIANAVGEKDPGKNKYQHYGYSVALLT